MNAALRLSALAGLLALPAAASATSLHALTLEDLSVRATDIVEGTVDDLTPRWQGGLLFTDVTVSVRTCLKGDCAASTVVIQSLGGVADGLVVEAAGAARYRMGEEVVVFLEPLGPSSAGRFRTAGMALGKFRVAAAGDLPVVERDLAQLELLGPERPVTVGENALPLAELRRRIVAHLAP